MHIQRIQTTYSMHKKKRQEAVPPSGRIDLAFQHKYNHVKTDPPKTTKNDTERQQSTNKNAQNDNTRQITKS